MESRVDGRDDGIRRVQEFWVDCIPPKTTHHAKKIVSFNTGGGRVSRLADSPALQYATAFWDAHLSRFRPPTPFSGPVMLELDFVWPWLSSDTKAVRAGSGYWHDRKPDCDNLAKVVQDSLARCGFFEQDSRVSRLCVAKYRGPKPGVRVRVEELT